jgi:hypothetical protein
MTLIGFDWRQIFDIPTRNLNLLRIDGVVDFLFAFERRHLVLFAAYHGEHRALLEISQILFSAFSIAPAHESTAWHILHAGDTHVVGPFVPTRD